MEERTSITGCFGAVCLAPAPGERGAKDGTWQLKEARPVDVADPTAEENILKASGRGILFMRTFMDEVSWERPAEGGTLVRMTKRK